MLPTNRWRMVELSCASNWCPDEIIMTGCHKMAGRNSAFQFVNHFLPGLG
jgi:hypothetical protein